MSVWMGNFWGGLVFSMIKLSFRMLVSRRMLVSDVRFAVRSFASAIRVSLPTMTNGMIM